MELCGEMYDMALLSCIHHHCRFRLSLSRAGEMFVSDFARRGLVDAFTLRLPTITVRSGVPSGAASSFVSDIVREVRNTGREGGGRGGFD